LESGLPEHLRETLREMLRERVLVGFVGRPAQ